MRVTAAVVLAAALAACGREETPEHALPPSDPSVPLEAEVGETIRLVVNSNPTTGYRWEMSTPPDGRGALLHVRRLLRHPGPEGDGGRGGQRDLVVPGEGAF